MKSENLMMRVTADWLATIDAWCERQPDKPNRSEAIRRLVDAGMTGSGQLERVTIGGSDATVVHVGKVDVFVFHDCEDGEIRIQAGSPGWRRRGRK